MPKLKDTQLKALYKKLIWNYLRSGGEIEKEVIDETTGKKTIEKVDINKLLNEAEDAGDYSSVHDALSNSKDPRARAIASKMKAGMTALLFGAYSSDKKEEKKEDKKEDKK